MRTDELIRFLAFVGLVATVYVLAGGILVRALVTRIRGERIERSRRSRWFRDAVLGLAVLGVLCFAYGYFVEPYWPEVVRVQVTSRKIPAGRTLRIVHLSDLHSEATVRLERRLPEIVADERPDLIVFSGDALNDPGGLETFRDCMSALAAIAPVYAVRGNWDQGFWAGTDLYAGTGVRELRNRSETVEIDGLRVCITGLSVGDPVVGGRVVEDPVRTLLDGVPDDAFNLFLHHYPDRILDVAATRRADLYCAGHTHGGQIALPVYGAIITLSKFGKRFEAGLYDVDGTALYVTRGVGMEGGSAPRVRFCARPEVTVIEVVGTGKAGAID